MLVTIISIFVIIHVCCLDQQQPGAYAQDGSGYTPAARPGYTAPPPPGGEVSYPQNG